VRIMAVPKYDDMFNALLKALHELGGSASNAEIEEKTAKILNLSENDINEIHRGNRTKFSYRLAWTRTYLKNFNIIENSARGIWSLTIKGGKTTQVNKEEVNSYVKNLKYDKDSIDEEVEEEEEWKIKLLEKIMDISPDSFERLCQRILRECGFEKVEVTRRTGDGGIDGYGVFKLGGLLSLHVIFQCKRWKGNVSSKEIRDFRGAMTGRTDHGLFITTGNFTRDAKDEANRDGAPKIDLINGNSLVEKMKELKLGVNIEQEEKVEINKNWFDIFE